MSSYIVNGTCVSGPCEAMEVFTILAISTYIITILALYFIMRDDFLSRKEKIIGLLTLIFWPIIAIIVSIHNGYKYLTRSENND